MSDTPETDANGIDISSSIMQVQTKYVRADFAERLERERDALLELTRLHCDLYDQLCEQEEPSDALYGIFDRFKRTLPENKIT